MWQCHVPTTVASVFIFVVACLLHFTCPFHQHRHPASPSSSFWCVQSVDATYTICHAPLLYIVVCLFRRPFLLPPVPSPFLFRSSSSDKRVSTNFAFAAIVSCMGYVSHSFALVFFFYGRTESVWMLVGID